VNVTVSGHGHTYLAGDQRADDRDTRAVPPAPPLRTGQACGERALPTAPEKTVPHRPALTAILKSEEVAEDAGDGALEPNMIDIFRPLLPGPAAARCEDPEYAWSRARPS
jgi:hypothetical protein